MSGLRIKKGRFVVITEANYHGRSTLLEAIGIAHNLLEPGDGREFVIVENPFLKGFLLGSRLYLTIKRD